MSITHTTRPAGADEIAREMDRRGSVIEALEAALAPNAERIAKLKAENARLRDALEFIDGLDPLEINLSNYDHQDVCRLNECAVQASLAAGAALSGRKRASDRFTIRDSHFGPFIDPAMPAGFDMIVVFANNAAHQPVWMGLPHQLYVKTALELMQVHGGTHLTVVPYRNADKFDVTEASINV